MSESTRNQLFRTAVFTLLTALTTLTGGRCVAQLGGQIAPQPLGVGFTRNVNQVSMMEYVEKLTEQLQIGQTMTQMMSRMNMEDMAAKVEEPVNGIAFYMVQGLIPSFANVSFQEVADEADAKRMLEAQKKLMGGNNSTIDEKGNGCYRFVRSSSWEGPVPEKKEPEAYVQELNDRYAKRQSRAFKNTAELIEKDGKPMVKQAWSMTQFYRFHNDLLFRSDFEEIWDMELPSRDSLVQGAEGDNDMGVEAYFDRIPAAIKTLGWNMLSSAAGVQMQQRDGEAPVIADLRKSSLQFGLNLVRTIMFDVDEANGWVQWADDEEQSVRGAIDFNARRNAGLTKQLEELSSGNSRFGAILRDDAPATLHTCLKIFEENDAMVQAAAAWLVHQIENEANGNQELVDAAGTVADTLTAISEHRTLEAFAKAGWTETTDGVIYAGLQVDDNPDLLRAIHAFVFQPASFLGMKPEMKEINGRAVIHIEFAETATQAIAAESGLNLGHVYVAHENSCLWLAAGGENSHEILWQSIERCEGQGLAVRTPLLSANLDVEEWLALPQDDPVGVSSLLLWLDANKQAFPPGPINARTLGGSEQQQQQPPTPLLQKCLDLGGDRRASFTVFADKSGLRASARLGEALGNYWISRMLDIQDRQMKAQQQRNQERMKKAQEAAKKANASE